MVYILVNLCKDSENRHKGLEKLMDITYLFPIDDHQFGEEYWEQRNQRMAENIVANIMTKPYKKNVLIVGAGHVISLSNALKTICPGLKVILMCESDRN